MRWNWTRSGEEALGHCPEGATGPASGSDGSDAAAWAGDQPDLSDCKSEDITQLQLEVRQEDTHESVTVSKLVKLTEPRKVEGGAETTSLYGGDLMAAVGVLEQVADRLEYRLQAPGRLVNRVGHVQQVSQNVVRAAGHLLAAESASAWRDLGEAERASAATALAQAVERHAAILAGVLADEGEEVEVEERNSEIGE